MMLVPSKQDSSKLGTELGSNGGNSNAFKMKNEKAVATINHYCGKFLGSIL